MDISLTLVDETGLNEGVVTAAAQAFVDASIPKQGDSKSAEQKEIERLRKTCQDYDDNKKLWQFFLKSYEGGPEYVGHDTLFRHSRESEQDFQERLNRAHYQNYCQPLVDFVPEYIFSQDVERSAPKDLQDAFEQFKKNCDRAGTSLNLFMQQVGEDMRIFGMCYIQVDKPANDNPDISVLDAQQKGLDQPYVVLIRPLEVLDYRIDSFGNLTYLKRVEHTYEDDGEDVINIERYTEWRANQYKISAIDVSDPKNPKLIKTGNYGQPQRNPWGVVPFVMAFFKRRKSNTAVGQSFLQDIAMQNRSVFNQTSLIDEFLYRQCFNILAMPAKSAIPLKDQSEGHIGTSNVVEVPSDAKITPQYITPPADPAQFIQSERENTVRQMYLQAAQDLMAELTLPGRHSGDSQRQQFSRTIPVINKTADALEQTEQRMMELWAKIRGSSWDGGKISYKDDYSITNLVDMLLSLSMLFNNVRLLSPTFIREEWKRLVREFDGKLDHDTLMKIESEIDSLSDSDIAQRFMTPQDIQAQANMPTTSGMIQGRSQSMLGSDKKIAAAGGTNAATKEKVPDANKRSTTPSRSTKK